MATYWPAFLAMFCVSMLGWFLVRLGRALDEEARREEEAARPPRPSPALPLAARK